MWRSGILTETQTESVDLQKTGMNTEEIEIDTLEDELEVDAMVKFIKERVKL